jgi:hypothetical protein
LKQIGILDDGVSGLDSYHRTVDFDRNYALDRKAVAMTSTKAVTLTPLTAEEQAHLDDLQMRAQAPDPTQIIGGLRKVMDDQDPPTGWLVSALRDLARELVADPKRQWLGERDPRNHICWSAADRLEACFNLPHKSGPAEQVKEGDK